MENITKYWNDATKIQKQIAVFIFAGVMAWLLVSARAAGPFSSLELEYGTVSSPASLVNDPLASGGSYVLFGSSSGEVASRIQAEDYTDGGEGVAYHDTTSGNLYSCTLRNDDVDIKNTSDSGGGCMVGHFAGGEWLKYSINVETAGNYVLTARVASGLNDGSSFSVDLNGADVSGTVNVPYVGNWDTDFDTIGNVVINLPAGSHTLTINSDDFFDLNWFELSGPGNVTVEEGTTPPPPPPPSGSGAFIEENGLVMVEMESENVQGDWQMRTEYSDYSGSGYYYMDGNEYSGLKSTDPVVIEDPNGPITYSVQISSPGTYRIALRAATYDGGFGHADWGNDCFIKASGQGDSRSDFIKLYGGSFQSWGWAQDFDNHEYDHVRAEFDFNSSGTYTIEIAGRSRGFAIDRFVLYKADQWTDSAAKAVTTESSRTGGNSGDWNTELSINGSDFYINGQITYPGTQVEGLLMNSRMIQAITDDEQDQLPFTSGFNPEQNTDDFIAMLPTYKSYGMLAFTVGLQGGYPGGSGGGHQPGIRSAFNSDGSLKTAWVNRLDRVIEAADANGMIVMVNYFYFGQDDRLANEAAVVNAVNNMTNHLVSKGYTNIMVDLANEHNIADSGGHWFEHSILYEDGRIDDLIKQISDAGIPTSTSKAGGIPGTEIRAVSDIFILHGNGQSPSNITSWLNTLRPYNKPMFFNEDPNGLPNMNAAVDGGASWGFYDDNYDLGGFQRVPSDWSINSSNKWDFFNRTKELSGF